MAKQKMWYCDHCGSSDLVRDAWVTVNHTEEEGQTIVDAFSNCFCRTCEESTYPIHHRVYQADREKCKAENCRMYESAPTDTPYPVTCKAKPFGLKCVPFWLD